MLFENDRPKIPVDYDLAEAQKAASRRFGRRVGQLAIERVIVRGFRNQTDGLWVPHSQAEFTSVVKDPRTQLRSARFFIDNKYFLGKRYWETLGKFKTYLASSVQHKKGLDQALLPDRSFTPDSILQNANATRWMENYAIALGGFAIRKWAQPHWTKRIVQARQDAQDYIGTLNDEDLMLFYDEAVWSTRSREQYWTEKLDIIQANYDVTSDPNLVAPDYAYDDDPENYINDLYPSVYTL